MSLVRRHIILIVVALVLLGAGLVWLKAGAGRDSGLPGGSPFNMGGPFSLVAANDATFTEHSWPGKLLVIDFGYRFCPDVCPTNLQTMADALHLLGPDADRVQPLFITVDPERDGAAEMAAYAAQFHPRLIGLTGTPAQINAIARAFRVYHRVVPGHTADSYTVDHSAFTYLVNDRGVVLKLFGHDTKAEPLAAGIRDVLQRQQP